MPRTGTPIHARIGGPRLHGRTLLRPYSNHTGRMPGTTSQPRVAADVKPLDALVAVEVPPFRRAVIRRGPVHLSVLEPVHEPERGIVPAWVILDNLNIDVEGVAPDEPARARGLTVEPLDGEGVGRR